MRRAVVALALAACADDPVPRTERAATLAVDAQIALRHAHMKAIGMT